MYKPVENERYSVDQEREWFRVLYTHHCPMDRTTYNDRPIAHYKTREKAEQVADKLNEAAEI